MHPIRLPAEVWSALEAEAGREQTSLSAFLEGLVRSQLPHFVHSLLSRQLAAFRGCEVQDSLALPPTPLDQCSSSNSDTTNQTQ